MHDSGWPIVIVGDRDGAPMMLVPGGSFSMGNDEGAPPEAPAHTVRLSTFYIDQHEVTNRQFRLFLAETHYRGQPPGKWLSDDKARAEPEALPVVMVNANDAKAFADWAAKQLPTEAQWEMAARSSDSRLYPWGNEPNKTAKPRILHQISPIMARIGGRFPVRSFRPGRQRGGVDKGLVRFQILSRARRPNDRQPNRPEYARAIAPTATCREGGCEELERLSS